jgi:hypothetical protein
MTSPTTARRARARCGRDQRHVISAAGPAERPGATTFLSRAGQRSHKRSGSQPRQRRLLWVPGFESEAVFVTTTYSSHVNVTGLSSRVAGEVKASYAAASHFGAGISDHAHTAFVAAMHVALLTGAGASLMAAFATVILLARRPDQAPADERAVADLAVSPSADTTEQHNPPMGAAGFEPATSRV